jgi:hypothetical protein
VTAQWDDLDVVEWRFDASNGAFCGSAGVYAGHDSPNAWADAVRGFPRDSTDSRLIECGASNDRCAGGYARLHFHCVDASGHAALEVLLISDWNTSGESVKLTLPITAAHVDAFVRELHSLTPGGHRSARLSRAV